MNWSRALALFAGAVGLATLLGWFGRFHPLLEALTNVAPQMLLFSLILCVWSAQARQPVPAAIGLVALAWFLWLLVPYWFGSGDPRPADPARVHTALQYNVYFGNEALDAAAAEIREANASIVALHEITTEQWVGLRERLPEFPHAIAEPWDGGALQLGGGMALMSRQPLTEVDIDPRADVEGRPILAASTLIGSDEVVVVGLHPHASRFERHKYELRDRQLDAVAKALGDESRPAMILTDLNMAPTSPDYRSLLDELGWRDPHRDTGWDASWPTWGGPFGLPIDHVLVSDQLALHDISTGAGGGSDHRSVLAEFSVR